MQLHAATRAAEGVGLVHCDCLLPFVVPPDAVMSRSVSHDAPVCEINVRCSALVRFLSCPNSAASGNAAG